MNPTTRARLSMALGIVPVAVLLGVLCYPPSQAEPTNRRTQGTDKPHAPDSGPAANGGSTTDAPPDLVAGPLGEALQNLNLTAKQKTQIAAILQNEHQQTRTRISALLTTEQRARFEQFGPGDQGGTGGRQNTGQNAGQPNATGARNGAKTLTNKVSVTTDATYRYIKSNGIPDHPMGQFPNRNNPSTVSEQQYSFRMLLQPRTAPRTRQLEPLLMGVAINGVPFDPETAEFWNHDRDSGWRYEAVFGALNMGLDQNNAHVQPSGAYHYHGLPTALLNRLHGDTQMALVGYAADGFPIYGPYCYSDPKDANSPLKAMQSSYRLKQGTRPGGDEGPGGTYDGTFEQDYEYVAGAGDLDEANGRYGITPDYPGGTYYYVLSTNWPIVPRLFKGRPDPSFMHQGPGPGQGGGRPGGPPPPGGGPPPDGPQEGQG